MPLAQAEVVKSLVLALKYMPVHFTGLSKGAGGINKEILTSSQQHLLRIEKILR